MTLSTSTGLIKDTYPGSSDSESMKIHISQSVSTVSSADLSDICEVHTKKTVASEVTVSGIIYMAGVESSLCDNN